MRLIDALPAGIALRQENARLKEEVRGLTVERDSAIKRLDDRIEQERRSEHFWRCRHGFHRMDKATRLSTFLVPGWIGECRRCGTGMRMSFL